MHSLSSTEPYSPREIARAAGVSVEQVVAALGGTERLVRHADAVRLGRALAAGAVARVLDRRDPLFSMFGAAAGPRRTSGVPLVLSSTLHAGLVAALFFIATLGLSPTATTLDMDEPRPDDMRLVFLSAPGPGGGGGGGGTRQKAPPPKALRAGLRAVSSPIPIRRTPPPVVAAVAPPEPKPALDAEPLPPVVAPIVPVAADNRSRMGVLQQAQAETDSRGPGQDGGIGAGAGTGLGEGEGPGVGPGSGGGTGGGPFRPGAGIEPPRLIREVKADYTDDARRRGVEGEVVLEIVVRRDGTVGDVKMLKRLGGGLEDRAVAAVRQWRFAPARRHGTPVDVIVEVAVEFKLR